MPYSREELVQIINDLLTERERPSRVDRFNQAIRGIVILSFTFIIGYGFIISKVLSTETLVVLASVVYTWWFSDEKKKDANKAVAAPAAGGLVA